MCLLAGLRRRICRLGPSCLALDDLAQVPGLFRSIPAVPARPGLGGHREMIQDAVGEESDAGAVQRGGEPVGHSGRQGDDLVEVVQAAAAAQLFGVVHGGVETQDMLTLGAAGGT
jgi:hypothetical protein